MEIMIKYLMDLMSTWTIKFNEYFIVNDATLNQLMIWKHQFSSYIFIAKRDFIFHALSLWENYYSNSIKQNSHQLCLKIEIKRQTKWKLNVKSKTENNAFFYRNNWNKKWHFSKQKDISSSKGIACILFH